MIKQIRKNTLSKQMITSCIILLLITSVLITSILTLSLIAQENNLFKTQASIDQFTYYKEITLNSSQVNTTLTNFPVCINLSSDDDLASKALDNAWDIAFFNESDVQLNHEIELFNGTTGQLVAWVNVTTLTHDADTTIKMYYGDSDIGSSAENIAGTWDSNYLVVYHMNDVDNGLTDSTANNNDATESVSNPLDANDYQHEAVAGYGVRYQGYGSSDISENHVMPSLMSNAGWEAGFTLEAWFKPATNDQNNYEIIDIYDDAYIGLNIKEDGGKRPRFLTKNETRNDELYSTSTITIGTWYYHVGTYDGTTKSAYIDSGDKQTSNEDSIFAGSSANNIGSNYNDDYGLDGGIVDEIRISNISRSQDYVTVTYATMYNATDGGFFSLGSEQGDTSGTYEISGLDANTRFPFSGEAEDVVWSTGNITMSIHTNASGTTENCTDIFIDLKDGIDVDIDEEQFAIAFINSSDGNWATISSVLTVTDGGNMTLNATTWDTGVAAGWAHGTNPFPIDSVNTTIEMRCRVTIPAGKAANTYTVDDWEVLWKVITT